MSYGHLAAFLAIEPYGIDFVCPIVLFQYPGIYIFAQLKLKFVVSRIISAWYTAIVSLKKLQYFNVILSGILLCERWHIWIPKAVGKDDRNGCLEGSTSPKSVNIC